MDVRSVNGMLGYKVQRYGDCIVCKRVLRLLVKLSTLCRILLNISLVQQVNQLFDLVVERGAVCGSGRRCGHVGTFTLVIHKGIQVVR